MTASTQEAVKFAQADPSQFGGKILTEKTRDKIQREQDKVSKEQQREEHDVRDADGDGFIRDPKGRIMMTDIERMVIKGVEQRQRTGAIKFNCQPGFEVYIGKRPLAIDLAFPDLLLAIECDGETFHGSPKQISSDKARDAKLNNLGWIVMRFGEKDIKTRFSLVMDKIVQEVTKREVWLGEQRKQLEQRSKESKIGNQSQVQQ